MVQLTQVKSAPCSASQSGPTTTKPRFHWCKSVRCKLRISLFLETNFDNVHKLTLVGRIRYPKFSRPFQTFGYWFFFSFQSVIYHIPATYIYIYKKNPEKTEDKKCHGNREHLFCYAKYQFLLVPSFLLSLHFFSCILSTLNNIT